MCLWSIRASSIVIGVKQCRQCVCTVGRGVCELDNKMTHHASRIMRQSKEFDPEMKNMRTIDYD